MGDIKIKLSRLSSGVIKYSIRFDSKIWIGEVNSLADVLVELTKFFKDVTW